ncbi:hypothetical protein GCM10029978_008010 [Actinoallomurus acanthiterrae]
MRIRRRSPLSAAILLTSVFVLTDCSSGYRASSGQDTLPKSPTPAGVRTEPNTMPTHIPNSATPSASHPVVVVHITTLRSRQTISLPTTIGYAISGPRFNAAAGYRLHVQVGNTGSYGLDLPISGPTGTVQLPRDKTLPGKRDLIISLIRADTTSARLAQRPARLNDVTIYGPK